MEQLTLETVQGEMRARLTDFHAAQPVRQWAPQAVVQDRTVSEVVLKHAENGLIADGVLRRQDDHIALAAHDPWALLTDAQRARLDHMEGRIRHGAVTPPDIATVLDAPDDADLLALLIGTGRVVAMVNVGLNQRLVFHADALARAARDLTAAFPPATRFTTGQARAALATTRKFIVPVLEHFDAQGITLRSGDTRQMAPPAQ